MKNTWQTQAFDDLALALTRIKNQTTMRKFLRDLCTLDELTEMSLRWQVAQLLYEEKLSYRDIAKRTKTSTTTVARIAQWLWHGESGYMAALQNKS